MKEKWGGLGKMLWGEELLTMVAVKSMASRREMLLEILNYSGFIGGDSVS